MLNGHQNLILMFKAPIMPPILQSSEVLDFCVEAAGYTKVKQNTPYVQPSKPNLLMTIQRLESSGGNRLRAFEAKGEGPNPEPEPILHGAQSNADTDLGMKAA